VPVLICAVPDALSSGVPGMPVAVMASTHRVPAAPPIGIGAGAARCGRGRMGPRHRRDHDCGRAGCCANASGADAARMQVRSAWEAAG